MKIFIKELIINNKTYNDILINDLVTFKIKNEEYHFKSNENLKIKKIIFNKYRIHKIYFYKKCLRKQHIKNFFNWLNINGVSSFENISCIKKHNTFETVSFMGTYKKIHTGTEIHIHYKGEDKYEII